MQTLKVMTWNVENLFLPGEDGGAEDEAAFAQKLAGLVETILQLAPDVLAVQEVGSEEASRALQAELKRYPYGQLSTLPDRRGIRVGFLSRLLIEGYEDFAAFPEGPLASVPGLNAFGDPEPVTRMGRGALRVLVRPLPELPIQLVTAHLKSKLLSFPSDAGQTRFSPRDEDERAFVAGLALLRRTAEAVTLRVKANDLLVDQKVPLIVLGDLNDVTDAATTQILQGPPGSELGTGGFDRPDKGDDARLFNLAPLIPETQRYSRVYRGQGELIDHILVSEELLPGSSRAWPLVDSHVDILDGLPSVSDVPSERRSAPRSDHAPVTATFDLGDGT